MLNGDSLSPIRFGPAKPPPLRVRLIVERLKLLSQARSTAAMARFSIGEMVRFDAGDVRTITGRIIRLNKKTISILTSDHERWNVAPVFLERAKDE